MVVMAFEVMINAMTDILCHFNSGFKGSSNLYIVIIFQSNYPTTYHYPYVIQSKALLCLYGVFVAESTYAVLLKIQPILSYPKLTCPILF